MPVRAFLSAPLRDTMGGVIVLDERSNATPPCARSTVRAAVDSLCRILALSVAGGLNVVGWMTIYRGPWRIGLWIVVLSTQLLVVVLWEPDGPRS